MTPGSRTGSRGRTHRSLSTSERRNTLAVESANIGVWDLNPITGELIWSARAKAFVGLPADAEISCQLFLTCLHPEDRERVDGEIKRVLVPGGSGEYHAEYRVFGIPDQVERWLSIRGRVYFNNRKAVRFIGTATDITSEKKYEEELHRLARELARSNVDLEDFAALVAHDLVEPLRTVSSFLRLMSERGLVTEKSGREFLQYAQSGATQMKSLVNGLLSYSRVRIGDAVFCQVDTAKVLRTVLTTLKALIDENQAGINYVGLPHVQGNEVLLSQVFQNLLANAIQYRSSEAPLIQVAAKRQGQEWLFSVRDNGVGFSRENNERIFLIFQRLPGPSENRGAGVGLAICRKIVEHHGGRIWAESEPGKGSVFYFSIPVTQSTVSVSD